MAAISRRRGGVRRLHLAGLCRRAHHAPDGADLPAVAASASRSSRCRARCSSRDSAIDRSASRSATSPASCRSRRRRPTSLQKDLEQLTLQLRQERSERDRLNADLAAQRQSADALKIERDQLTERLTSMMAERDALDGAAGAAKEAEPRPPTCRRRSSARRSSSRGSPPRSPPPTTRRASCSAISPRSRSRRPSRRPRWCASPPSWPALKDELARLNAALDAADVKAKEQNAQIVDLGQKLNRALASKVEELARYRSEFFGKLREALAGQRDVQIVGDRFVFQSEVLFPSGSAAAAAGRREAARQRRPAADRDQLARSPRTSTGCCRSTATPTTSRSTPRSSRRTGSCRRRAPSPS